MDEALQYERALKRAILSALGVTKPPFLLKVDAGVGDVSADLLDTRKDPRDPSDGVFVANALLHGDLRADNVQAMAKKAADTMRADLEKYMRKGVADNRP